MSSLRVCGQQIDAGLHGHYVHVQVKHDLPAGGFAELLNDNPFRIKCLHRCDCDLLRGPRDFCEIIRRNIENTACAAFGITSVCPGERGMMSRKARVCRFS